MPEADNVAEEEFDPVFAGTEQEQAWVRDSLRAFYDEGLLTDVLYRVKGGKEANVYCCRAHPATGLELLAAKVFRPRIFRAMKNDWFYKQGRTFHDPEGKAIYDGRNLKAVRQNTRRGRQIDMASWCYHEYETIAACHAAGADVPRPFAHGHNSILMEFIGDESQAAPILQRVSLSRPEARELFDRLMYNVEVMLACYRIHADLSAYNVLYWDGRGTLIDFPQAVDPHTHPQALSLLVRDVERLCRYFTRQGLTLNPGKIAHDLWDRFLRGEL